MSDQCIWVGSELYHASMLTAKAMSGRAQLARYIKVSIAPLYGTLESKRFLKFKSRLKKRRLLTCINVFANFTTKLILKRANTS